MPADIADEWGPGGDPLEPGPQASSHAHGVAHQVAFDDLIEHGRACRTRDRVGIVGMRDDEAGRLRELVHQRRGSQERTERRVPSPEPLGERDRVGPNVGIVVRREEPAGTEGGHDLVEHEADAVAVADFANAPSEGRMWHVHAGRLAADRLHHEREDLLGADPQDRLLEGGDARGGGSLRARGAEREGRGDLLRRHRQRAPQRRAPPCPR